MTKPLPEHDFLLQHLLLSIKLHPFLFAFRFPQLPFDRFRREGGNAFSQLKRGNRLFTAHRSMSECTFRFGRETRVIFPRFFIFLLNQFFALIVSVVAAKCRMHWWWFSTSAPTHTNTIRITWVSNIGTHIHATRSHICTHTKRWSLVEPRDHHNRWLLAAGQFMSELDSFKRLSMGWRKQRDKRKSQVNLYLISYSVLVLV